MRTFGAGVVADPHAIERDHERLKLVRDLPPGTKEPISFDLPCRVCGVIFFVAASRERHLQGHLETFIAEATAKRTAWENRWVRPRIVPKEECE